MSYLQRLVNWAFRFEDLSPLQDRSYLLRWTLLSVPFSNGRKIYLHKGLASDWSREPHDHPKTFISIGLKGSYIEERYIVLNPNTNPEWRSLYKFEEVEFVAPWVRAFDTNVIHRLRAVDGQPFWTICLTGEKTTDWGFYEKDGTRVPFIEYMRRIYGEEWGT